MYQKGKIELTSGKVEDYKKLNYNAFLDRFEFFQNDKRYIIGNPQIIDKIYYSDYVLMRIRSSDL